MTSQRGFSLTASEKMTQDQVNERAKAYREEQRIKALYYLHRTSNMDLAPMLGLVKAPDNEEVEAARKKQRRNRGYHNP